MAQQDPGSDGVPPVAGISDVALEVLERVTPPGYVASLIRTWVPIGVGAVLAYVAARWHVVLPDGVSTQVVLGVAALSGAVYYALARLVERRWPRVGRWLLSLGTVAAQPVYGRPGTAVRLTAPGGQPRHLRL